MWGCGAFQNSVGLSCCRVLMISFLFTITRRGRCRLQEGLSAPPSLASGKPSNVSDWCRTGCIFAEHAGRQMHKEATKFVLRICSALQLLMSLWYRFTRLAGFEPPAILLNAVCPIYLHPFTSSHSPLTLHHSVRYQWRRPSVLPRCLLH